MFFELLYYYPLVNIINLGIFLLLEYVSDTEMFTENIKNYGIKVGLWTINKYHTCKDLCMKYIYPYIKPYLDESVPKYSYFNKQTQRIHNVNSIPIEVIEHMDEYKIYYNHVTEEDDLTTTRRCVELHNNSDIIGKVEHNDLYKHVSPFIQIEIHIKDGDIFDIGQIIKEFLVSGNILDHHFFTYIMQHSRKYSLSNKEYSIKCMDQNINMVTIEKTSSIMLTDDGYTVEDNN